jgi:diacylglycerol kinase (ATP)
MPRRVLVVYNPASGVGKARGVAAELERRLGERFDEVVVRATDPHLDVFSDALPEGCELIVLIGGDGLAHAAVNGLGSTPVPLLFVGTGTVNVLALELGLPRDVERAARLAEGGRRVTARLMEAGARGGLLFAEAGFLGDVVAAVNRWRIGTGKHGKTEFVAKALAIIPRSWGRPLSAVITDESGRRTERRYSNVLATRVRCYAGNMPMPIPTSVTAPFEERSFLVVGFRTRTPFGHATLLGLAALRLLPLLARPLQSLGLLDAVWARSVSIEGPASTGVHVDAETFLPGGAELALPLDVRVGERTFTLVAP